MESLDLDAFANRTDETFRISLTDGVSLPLTLDSTIAAQDQRSDGRPFSVVFCGPAEPRLPQSTYRMEHPGIGAFDIFLVPVGLSGNGVFYEAVFN